MAPAFWDRWKQRKDRQPDLSSIPADLNPGNQNQREIIDQAATDIMAAFSADQMMQSFKTDPQMWTTSSPYLENPFFGKQQFTSAILRNVAKVPWVAPIPRVICTHLGKFGRPAKHPGEFGYKIVLKPQYDPSPENTAIAAEISDWFQTCGTVSDSAWDMLRRDNLATYLKKVGRDSLILDAGCTEIKKGFAGQPEAWQAVDAATIYRTKADPRMEFNPNDAAFVQVINGKQTAAYSIDEMSYIVRNVDTDIVSLGYGSPELLCVSRVILNILMAYDYNQKYFQQGGPAGVLVGSGKLPQEQFASLVRQLRFMTSGVANAHRLPVVNLPENGDMKWITFNGFSNRDMGYYDWILMNMKFVAANFQIALEETGFYMGREGEGGSFVQSNDFEAKIKASQSKGLSDMLDAIEDMLNKYMLAPHARWKPHKEWGRFEFKFVGLDSKTNTHDMAELASKLTTSCWTVDEARVELFGKPPLPEGRGQFMRDPNYLATSQMIDAQQATDAQPAEDPTANDWTLPEKGQADAVTPPTTPEVVETAKSFTFEL